MDTQYEDVVEKRSVVYIGKRLENPCNMVTFFCECKTSWVVKIVSTFESGW